MIASRIVLTQHALRHVGPDRSAAFSHIMNALHAVFLMTAVDLVQSGRRMPVGEAFSRGLVTRVVARVDLGAAAVQVAEMLAKNDAGALAANKVWLGKMRADLAEARQEHDRHRRQP
jgi:enoyl-CoA hydratase/carnithine racemase